MKNCKKCGNEFNPTKGLINYCSLQCRNSRNHTQNTREKISLSQNGNGVVKEKQSGFCECCGKQTKTQYQKCCSTKCHQDKLRNEKIKAGTLQDRAFKSLLIKIHGPKCMECGWDKINSYSNKPAVQLDHKDGNADNNTLENLRLLCPNCHSLTPTFGALNKGNGKRIYIQRK